MSDLKEWSKEQLIEKISVLNRKIRLLDKTGFELKSALMILKKQLLKISENIVLGRPKASKVFFNGGYQRKKKMRTREDEHG